MAARDDYVERDVPFQQHRHEQLVGPRRERGESELRWHPREGISEGGPNPLDGGGVPEFLVSTWTAVLAAQPAAQAECLLPMDVNYPSVFWTNAQPYPQGGRLNNYVNIPAQYMAAGSDISRMKVEALSCGLTYRRLDVARVAMTYPQSAMSWAVTGMAYLFPWSDGSCPYTDEYLAALNAGTPLTGAWAMDQFTLQSLPLPLPSNPASAIVQ